MKNTNKIQKNILGLTMVLLFTISMIGPASAATSLHRLTIDVTRIDLAWDTDVDNCGMWCVDNPGEIYLETPNGIKHYLGSYEDGNGYSRIHDTPNVRYSRYVELGMTFTFKLWDRDGSEYELLWIGYIEIVGTGGGETWSPVRSVYSAKWIGSAIKVHTQHTHEFYQDPCWFTNCWQWHSNGIQFSGMVSLVQGPH